MPATRLSEYLAVFATSFGIVPLVKLGRSWLTPATALSTSPRIAGFTKGAAAALVSEGLAVVYTFWFARNQLSVARPRTLEGDFGSGVIRTDARQLPLGTPSVTRNTAAFPFDFLFSRNGG